MATIINKTGRGFHLPGGFLGPKGRLAVDDKVASHAGVASVATRGDITVELDAKPYDAKVEPAKSDAKPYDAKVEPAKSDAKPSKDDARKK